MDRLSVRGIIFDYGGTLDTRGDHWSEVIWKAYLHEGIGVDGIVRHEVGMWVEKWSYRLAYVYAERALAVAPIVKPGFTFEEMLREKIVAQLSFLSGGLLVETGKDDKVRQSDLPFYLPYTYAQCREVGSRMAAYVGEQTKRVQEESRQVLEKLRQAGYPMALVSNFYGNISTVLEEAGLRNYFSKVVESAVVGVRKPNPAIFALGVCALDLPASEVLVVGDSFSKDMIPAHSLGCRTLWFKGLQWEDVPFDLSVCDGIIYRLEEMIKYV